MNIAALFDLEPLTLNATDCLREDDKWESAIKHEFMDGIRSGNLDEECFDRWLIQERHGLIGLSRAWAELIKDAPQENLRFVLDAMSSFVEEVDWFSRVARIRGLDMDAPKLPATVNYINALADHVNISHEVGMASMWAVHQSRVEAWQYAAPGNGQFCPFVERWIRPSYAKFADNLRQIVDKQYEHLVPSREVQNAVNEVVYHRNLLFPKA